MTPPLPTLPSLFFFGYGYVAQHLARRLKGNEQHDEWTLGGCQRKVSSPHSRPPIQLFNFADLSPEILDQFDHFLVSIPPDQQGDIVLQHFNSYFRDRKKPIQWIGYLSATSVYGDHGGAWVDENSPCHPTSERGENRLMAERQWLELPLPIHIFRLSGIYGPGRSPFDAMDRGPVTPIDKPGHLFSRIHVDDIVQILLNSICSPLPKSIYNVADDHPATSAELYEYAYELVNQSPPPRMPYDPSLLSPAMNDFYRDNKKVSNAKIKQELTRNLLYPSYEYGLKNCLDFWREKNRKEN